MGGRGNSGSSGRNANSAAPKTQEQEQTYRPLLNRNKVDEYIKDFTPETFLGGPILSNDWTNTSLKDTGTINAPDTIDVGGYEFRSMGAPVVERDTSDKKMNTSLMHFEYQSQEKVGNEYPVLSITIKVKRSKRGTTTEIVKEGYDRTQFW